MKNMFFDRFTGWKNKAYDAVFAKKVEAEHKAAIWKTLFIVTISVVAVVAAGVATYTVLKKKFDKDIVAVLKEKLSKKCCCEETAEEVIEEALEEAEAVEAVAEVVEA